MAYAITKALGSGAPGSLVPLLAGGSVLLGVFTAIAHLASELMAFDEAQAPGWAYGNR
ncbi:hypothetical protein [Streptomyces nigrescens]|uniref:Uncharacterized protein n=1 Tax=Streptomyces nigrescens TaxID=1920 RepID=A0ABY7ITH1_STRNI|nr:MULTISPECIES: hypothetical protein [Streptomyces]MCX5451408.1 hypothetical protein [Streptomyces libani]WAU02174.1 hypothetical protein STRNI_000148 [Streptomyces nigrescens]